MGPDPSCLGTNTGRLPAIAASLVLALSVALTVVPARAVADAPTRPSGATVASVPRSVTPSVTPSVGSTSGGTVVKLVGRRLNSIDRVTFGGIAARRLVHRSARRITVTAPAHASGTVALRLYDGAALKFRWQRAFTYVGRPSISSLTPDAGPLTGRTITVHGKNLVRGARVLFAGKPGGHVTWLSNSALTVSAPAHAAGAVAVRVETVAGASASGSQALFTYGLEPQVSSYSPESGPAGGGTLVTIDGSHLDEVTQVMFGDKQGTALTRESPTRLTVRSPAHAAGEETLRLVSRFGSASPGSFSFEGPGPGGLIWSAGQNLVSTIHGGLTRVECPTTTFCAGFDQSGAVVTYSGGAWSSPVFVHDFFTDLSCATASYCVAVDSDFPQSPTYVWDGTSWSEGAPLPEFVGNVDCWGVGSCMAVGSGEAFTLSGGAWHSHSLADESFDGADVSCGGPSFCVAVDDFTGTAETYDGVAWRTTLADSGSRPLERISCLPSGTCAALDLGTLEPGTWRLWTYDGTTWAATDPAPVPDSGPSDLSCSPNGTCTVVGTVDGTTTSGSGIGGGFAISFDGAWEPAVRDIGGSLDGISCASDTACTAVGAYLEPGHLEGGSLVERRNGFAVRGMGSTWTAPLSVDPDRYGDLGEVSCVAKTFCMSATGARFDGTAWHVSAPINPYGQGTMSVNLDWVGSDAHISCTSVSFCLVAGNERDNGWDLGFYRGWWSTWNGSTWSAPAYLGQPVSDVSCVSSTHCVMTAMSSDSGGTPQASVFDGATWEAPISLPGSEVGEIDCVSTTTCVAAGSNDLIRLSGDTWSPLAIAADVAFVHDIDCVTTTFCLASVADANSNGHSSVRRWNGTTWSTEITSGRINDSSTILDVDCVATDVCFASQEIADGFGSNQVWAYDGSVWSGPGQPGHSDPDWPALVTCATRDACIATDPFGGTTAVGVRP